MEKSLDDLLKEKAAQAEAKKRAQAETEAAQAQEAASSVVADLQKRKRQLEIVAHSLTTEQSGRAMARGNAETASATLEAKAADFSQYGIDKEALLSEPDYADYKEVKAVKEAGEESEIYSVNSIETKELAARLQTLGLEVPSNASAEVINSLLQEAIQSLEVEIVSKRLETPGERELLIEEITTEHELLTDAKLARFNSFRRGYNGENQGLVGATVKEAADFYDSELARIPVLQTYPELRRAVIENIATAIVLHEEKEKTEKAVAERARIKEDAEKYNWGRQDIPSQTDYERYEICKSNLSHYEAKAVEAGISLEELVESDASVKSSVKSAQYEIRTYKEKITAPAERLTEYFTAKETLDATPRLSYEESSRNLESRVQLLEEASRMLLNLQTDLKVQFETNNERKYNSDEVRFLLPSELKRREENIITIRSLEAEIETLKIQRRELGSEPTGLFKKGVQKKWQENTATLQAKISQKTTELERIKQININMNVSVNFARLGNALIEHFNENPTMTVAELKTFLREAKDKTVVESHKARDAEGVYTARDNRVRRLEQERLEVTTR